MGLAPAPGINDESVKEILRILLLKKQVCLTDFADDLLGAALTEDDSYRKFASAIRFFYGLAFQSVADRQV